MTAQGLCPSSRGYRRPNAGMGPPAERPHDCSYVRSVAKVGMLQYAGVAVGILFAVLFTAVAISQAVDKDANSRKVRVIAGGIAALFLAAIGGQGYAIYYIKGSAKRKMQAEWPISGDEHEPCKMLMTTKFGDKVEFTTLTSDGVAPVVLPAGNAISQLTIMGEPGQVSIVINRTMPDGSVKKITFPEGFDKIAGGSQSKYDAFFPTETNRIEVFCAAPCTIKYRTRELPAGPMVNYIKKYRIVARTCAGQVITVDEAHTNSRAVGVGCV
jgi:hypothetical protein